MKTKLLIGLMFLALRAAAAPVILQFQAQNICGPPPEEDCPAIVIWSTHAAFTVLTLEISRDGGTTWEFTGSSAGFTDRDQVSILSYGILRFTDNVPALMFRTVEY